MHHDQQAARMEHREQNLQDVLMQAISTASHQRLLQMLSFA
jgi:hypothetical protein